MFCFFSGIFHVIQCSAQYPEEPYNQNCQYNDYQYNDENGNQKILCHHGSRNINATLSLLKSLVDQTPEEIIIAGQSAGAAGCVANSPCIKDAFPDCKKFVVYADGVFLHTPLWKSIINEIWHVNEKLASYTISDNLILDLFRYAAANMPENTIFLQSNTIFDKILIQFSNKLNKGKLVVDAAMRDFFNKELLASTTELKKMITNYYYYLTDHKMNKRDGTTPHTFAGSPKMFYTDIQNGISVSRWLSDATQGICKDVGSGFLN